MSLAGGYVRPPAISRLVDVAQYGPPDDPSDQPTRMANYGAGGPLSPGFGEYPEYNETTEPEPLPTPWYRKRTLLVMWATLVAILIALIIYGLIELSTGGESTITPSTTAPSSTTTSSTTSTTTTSTNVTTTAPPPPPPTEAPSPGGNAPVEPVEPHHPHFPHDLPKLPPTITLPHTVITLPPGI